jgi:hypothetical protein
MVIVNAKQDMSLSITDVYHYALQVKIEMQMEFVNVLQG